MLETSFVRAAAILILPVSGHGNQTCLGRGGVVPQLVGNFIAIQPRQPDVAENNIWQTILRCLNSVWPGVR